MDGKPEACFRGKKTSYATTSVERCNPGCRGKHTKLISKWSQPAREWSRGDASDIDGQAEGRHERERMSQNFWSWLHRVVRQLATSVGAFARRIVFMRCVPKSKRTRMI